VLVVDDEEMVGQFMSDLLENWGLEVVVKTSPLDARTMFEADPTRFDLVVTDQTMPRITGVELAQQLLAVRPSLPVILYTGFADPLTSEQVQRCGVRALMTKPLEPGALFSVLSANLPKPPAARN
jgi:DNA-binding NtrC family response regulator